LKGEIDNATQASTPALEAVRAQLRAVDDIKAQLEARLKGMLSEQMVSKSALTSLSQQTLALDRALKALDEEQARRMPAIK
jgi:hypothetical protein